MQCVPERVANSMPSTAQTEVQGANADLSADDFLARERAILGDDANQFTTPGDNAAFDDNLLGGGDAETAQFESSFPDLATQNQVRLFFPLSVLYRVVTNL